ncbi:MAG: hypothetical protein M0031_09420 [Thermaerobacter sp.]|nr:hypothetical protein [Thermaerobacter sp.]
MLHSVTGARDMVDERELTEKARGMRALLAGLQRISDLADQEDVLRRAAPELAGEVFSERVDAMARAIRRRFGAALTDADVRLALMMEACRAEAAGWGEE